MMKRNNILVILFLLLTASVATAFAENGMNSPYTRFGYGQLSLPDLGAHKAMGGTGIGMRNANQLNLLNPASYSSVDTLTFILDMGVSVQNTNFAENGVRMNARNSTFDYIAAQYRLRRGLGMTLAYIPYANAGYEYMTSDEILTDEDGTISTTNKYSGDGGLRKMMVGLGWSPFKWISVGANAGYCYGELQHSVENSYSQSAINARTKIYSADFEAFCFDVGAQLSFGNKKNHFVLGATYDPGLTFSHQPYAVDYVLANSIATSADTVHFKPFSLPETLGAGFSYCYDERLTVAADASLSRFGSSLFFDQPGVDRYRASLGVEYIPATISKNFFMRLRYRAGLYYATNYFQVNGTAGPAEYGASIGVGIPILNAWNQRCAVNIAGQVVHMEPAAPGMITENYMRLNLSVSFIENWFAKWKVN